VDQFEPVNPNDKDWWWLDSILRIPDILRAQGFGNWHKKFSTLSMV
jgi:hypothetical protein